MSGFHMKRKLYSLLNTKSLEKKLNLLLNEKKIESFIIVSRKEGTMFVEIYALCFYHSQLEKSAWIIESCDCNGIVS